MTQEEENSCPEEGLLPSNNQSPKIQSTCNHNIRKNSSFTSFTNIFKDRDIFLRSSAKNACSKALLKGPRRVVRLCIFSLIIPVLLISTTLYIRQVLYSPYQYPMAPTDQRLINKKSSSIWCQGQSMKMNGSFNAFLMANSPAINKKFSTHVMIKHIILKDDVKEYWGFFLQKGSIIHLNLCTRYDGTTLMILRGVNNLKKCAWIGEEDSAEQDEDHKDTSSESGEPPKVMQGLPGVVDENEILGLLKSNKGFWHKASHNTINRTSKERIEQLDFHVQKVIQLSKTNKEIVHSLQKLKENSYFKNLSTFQNNMVKLPNRIKRSIGIRKKRLKSKELILESVKRTLDENPKEGAFEIMDDEDLYEEEANHLRQNSSAEVSTNITQEYFNLFHLPSGLMYERGKFNQTTNYDRSNEELRSSFSSSEEALTNCEGVLGVIPLFQSRNCQSFNDTFTNRITYKIPATGTYYFVFSSDNEVFDSQIFFNMTIQRVVFNTSNAKQTCLNQTQCSLSFSFWSHDQAIIEIPEGDWDSAYVMDINCQPRVAVYLAILILVPAIILLCAFR